MKMMLEKRIRRQKRKKKIGRGAGERDKKGINEEYGESKEVGEKEQRGKRLSHSEDVQLQ